MSIKVMTEVWDSSTAKGSRLLLMLALADHADDHGRCFPKLDTLAHKMRLDNPDAKSRNRNLTNLIRAQVEAGELVYHPGKGRGNGGEFWVLPPATVARLTAGKKGAEVAPISELKKGNVDAPFIPVEKGADSDTKRCNPVPEKVQKFTPKGAKFYTATALFPALGQPGFIPNRQEPSINHQGTVNLSSPDGDGGQTPEPLNPITEQTPVPDQVPSVEPTPDALTEDPADVEEVPAGDEKIVSPKPGTLAAKHAALMDAWNTHRGELPMCASLNGERRTLMDRLLKDAGSLEAACRMMVLATRVVARDKHWNGKNRDGKKYGITNLLRHVPDYAEKATHEDHAAAGYASPTHLTTDTPAGTPQTSALSEYI